MASQDAARHPPSVAVLEFTAVAVSTAVADSTAAVVATAAAGTAER